MMYYNNKNTYNKINFIEEKFSNGLYVFYHQDNTNPLVSISVLYHVGSKDEEPGKSGFAHLFEHLMFDGTKNIKKGDYCKYISSKGGINNAYTHQDETYYYETLPSNHLPLALWLEADRMKNAELDNKNLKIQKEIVKEEIEMHIRNTSYSESVTEIIPSFLFKKHPYKNSIVGTIEDLDSASYIDFKNFYELYYVPNNAILTVTGDFDIKVAKSLCKKYFAHIPKGKNEKYLIEKKKKIKNLKEDPISQEIITTFFDKNAQVPGIFLSYRISKIIDDDLYPLSILDTILSYGETSRMINSIINHQQIASVVGTYLDCMEDYGILTIYGIVNIGINVDTLLNAIDKEINLIKREKISLYELEKQKILLKKRMLNRKLMSTVSFWLSHYKLYYNDASLINHMIDKYLLVTPEDILTVANKYLNKNSRVRLYNMPK